MSIEHYHTQTIYHIETIQGGPVAGDKPRTVLIRAGSVYGRGAILAEGYESGTGDITSQLMVQAHINGLADDARDTTEYGDCG